MAVTPQPNDGYNGLRDYTPGLAADLYFDPAHYGRELKQIWYRNWIYVGRSSRVGVPRAYCTYEVGDQRLLLVRDDTGMLRGFHNTCRHRGAALCVDGQGTLRAGAVACPYHGWVYDLRGRLLRTSSKSTPAGFAGEEHSLYEISVREWRGFVFVCLGAEPPPFEGQFDAPLSRLAAWPLETVAVAHVLRKTVQCNWKIFWENYNECLHCPGVHPQLSRLVPIFGRGLQEERDDPLWPVNATDQDPKFKGGLRQGAETWSLDGRITGVPFADISAADRRLGAVYLTGLPSVFVVGHVDYVRVVRLRPLGPEQTELCVEYLFAPEAAADPSFDPRNVVEFTNRVMTEDAEVCELNQRGLHALPHGRGVVMPEEYLIRRFHQWVYAELARV